MDIASIIILSLIVVCVIFSSVSMCLYKNGDNEFIQVREIKYNEKENLSSNSNN
jgi:hypothetical protein